MHTLGRSRTLLIRQAGAARRRRHRLIAHAHSCVVEVTDTRCQAAASRYASPRSLAKPALWSWPLEHAQQLVSSTITSRCLRSVMALVRLSLIIGDYTWTLAANRSTIRPCSAPQRRRLPSPRSSISKAASARPMLHGCWLLYAKSKAKASGAGPRYTGQSQQLVSEWPGSCPGCRNVFSSRR